jgi:predicted DNA-binding transcriptional regulator AlpA
MESKLAYRVTEFADAIGVSRAKAYELLASGEVPCIRLGGPTGAIRVPVETTRAWIASRVAETRAAQEAAPVETTRARITRRVAESPANGR